MSNFPNFYNPSRIGSLFYPDVATIAAEATAAGLKPAVEDKENVHLVIIDIDGAPEHDATSHASMVVAKTL